MSQQPQLACWRQALRAVRGWPTPWSTLQRYWPGMVDEAPARSTPGTDQHRRHRQTPDWFEVVRPTRTQPLHTVHISVQDRSALPRR
ncbi:hypothetical protein AB0O01_00055 [Streptomyces sp. NPDC093252]|uniref:hypothetical protein n=1 Tax=Streptomyces sp. NPDC093252 TaxID=3154980 RepID=UPI003446EEFE